MTESTRCTAQARAAGGDWHRGMLRSAPVAHRGDRRVAPPWLVIKIGGSLLSRPRWPALLATLLQDIRPRPCRIIVGGGAVVDGLRTIDRAEPQPAPLMHSLAIEAMGLTARLVASALGLPVASGFDASDEPAVLDVPAWLAGGTVATHLPAGWQVTSDTIAACAATEHGGCLMLVKSVPPPPCPDAGDPIATAAAAGWVDEHFTTAAARLVEVGWAAPVAA